MSRSSRNLGAVVAFLILGLVIVGCIFVIKVAYDEPVPTVQETTAATLPTEPSETEPEEKRIALFQTNDIHGFLMDTTGGDSTKFQYRLAYIAKDVKNARESDTYEDVLLVDSGDIYFGTPVSNLSQGAAMRAAMDVMGYDAVTLGGHDYVWDVSKSAADDFCTLPAYTLGDITGDPMVPVICADLCYANNHNRTLFTKDYVIAEKGGYRVALIGYIPDYLNELPKDLADYYEIHADLTEFSERVKAINEAEKPDITIVVAHEDALTVASALSHDDVDLVCGGRTHEAQCGYTGDGIAYLQSDCNAQGYSRAVIVIDKDGNVTVEDPVNNSIIEYPEMLYDTLSNSSYFDSEVLDISHKAWDSISDQMKEALGYIETSVEKDGIISGHTTSGGNFLTSLMLEYTNGDGAIAAFCSRDAVCADFVVAEGGIFELSVGDMYKLCPYDDVWLIYSLTGKELAQLIADGFKDPAFGDQMSGIRFEYNNNGTLEAPEIEIVSIKFTNGTNVDLDDTETTYKICVTGSCASQPGSVFEGKTPLHSKDEAPVDNQALIEVLRKRRDGGNIHIPADTYSRGTCLNMDDIPEGESNADGGEGDTAGEEDN